MITDIHTDAWRGDWRSQLRRAVRSLDQLEVHLNLNQQERQGIRRLQEQGMPLLIPPYYLSLCDPVDSTCPIRRQCVPTIEESLRVDGDRLDPLGEEAHEVAPRLIRRYPDRALLLVTSGCAMHCRFCTRARLVSKEFGYRGLSSLEPAFRWLEENPDVGELLISGGDPFVASTVRLDALLTRIRRIKSIEVIRIGTRVPAALPMRVDDALVGMLQAHQPLWIMVHFNHPKELTTLSCRALRRLVDGGFPVMNQMVLLRGVNDDAEVLAALFRGLIKERVRPYYLLHGDVMEGTGHLRTDLSRSIELYDSLQGRLSGLALPKLMVDVPGGKGKVSVGRSTIVDRSPGRTVLRTYRGEDVEVLDPIRG
jgi:lysine 2,3-aminomutase